MRFFAWFAHWVRIAVAASSRKDFYRRIGERKTKEGIAHLALLAAFFWVLPFLIIFFVDARHAALSLTENLRTRVPAGTVFEIKDGKFSDNLAEPLVFGDKDFKVIIDSASGGASLAAGERGFVVNATGILQQDANRTQSVSFAGVPSFRWSREDIQQSIARWTPLALFLGALLAGFAVFATTLIGFLLSAALHALVLWFALKVAKNPWPWKRAFVASAFAATLPIALNAAIASLGAGRFAFVPDLLYWLILLWIAYDAVKRGSPIQGKSATDERKEEAAIGRPGDGRS